MTTTPPRTSLRVRTPPTPLHGPTYDNYEPYSPRRSKRSTAQSNPYSSLNADRSPQTHFPQNTTPPPSSSATTGKRARFARVPTHLSSPPSSPASPVLGRQDKHPHKTPRTQRRSHPAHAHHPSTAAAAAVAGGLSSTSDSEAASSPPSQEKHHSLAGPHVAPAAMLPTPSKTPSKKRGPAQPLPTTTARILTFQPNHPNDVMPSPRKLKQHHRHRPSHAETVGFELDDDDDDAREYGAGVKNGVGGRARAAARNGAIEIYTDANSRVPVWDESEENPFVGEAKGRGGAARPQRRSRKSREEVEREAKMTEAVGRGEGVVYVFRGKKLFRRFDDADVSPADAHDTINEDTTTTAEDLSTTPTQRRLRHQAGPAAQRPLTRSAIKPRLLFPPAHPPPAAERSAGSDDVDEEAATDIEMGRDVTPPPSEGRKARGAARVGGGGREKEELLSSSSELVMEDPLVEVGDEGVEDDAAIASAGPASSVSASASASPQAVRTATKRGARGAFDSWQRTKTTSTASTTGRKRAGEGGEEGGSGGGKRVRGGASLV